MRASACLVRSWKRRAPAMVSVGAAEPRLLRTVLKRCQLFPDTARCSCAFDMRERPLIPRRFASLYSCSFVRPFGLFVPERRPPRRPDEMSLVDERDAVLASPLRARSLLTVAAAICFARLVEVPRFLALSLMCSY